MTSYVVQGMAYFAMRPRLWLMTMFPLLLTIIVAVASVIILFSVAFAPQAEWFEEAGLSNWTSWLLAFMLVLVEIFFVTLVFKLVVMGSYQDKIFKQVMAAHGFKELVEDEKHHASCTRACCSCFRVSLWLRLVLLVVTLPINLLPIVGSVIYAWLNGTIVAWEYHLLFFELKNFTFAQQKAYVTDHKVQYSAFGMLAVLLEMIPGFGLLFAFTNTVGAALLAVHFEEEERIHMVLQSNRVSLQYVNTYDHVPIGGIV